MKLTSVITRIYAIVLSCTLLSLLPVFFYTDWPWLHKSLLLISVLLFASLLTALATKTLKQGMQSLHVGLQNFKDGEFSSSLAYSEEDEIGELCSLYNVTAAQLRQEKHSLNQRELMLDKVLQSSPDVLLLANDQGHVVFSNLAARTFFNATTRLEGERLDALLGKVPPAARDVINDKRTGLFSISKTDCESETWHITSGSFLLNNQNHTLFILKQMTRELSRQEVAVWKKVIRLISHELNNSLGPISSMLHSGKLISNQLDDTRMVRVFKTIEERIDHLNQFVQGYGKFAKLPSPQPSPINWETLLEGLHQQWEFHHTLQAGCELQADPVQLEQLLINLLKNAHESDSNTKDIQLDVSADKTAVHIDVSDRGKGMSETVMSNALIPFYSTKTSGSGLGLALCREIADAHHGNIALQNRPQGGLNVRVTLPRIHHV
ncbi:GHKL domain-containing protein [Alteromonas sediminis]|uniref:histidine kinase n=1 Tax=Alteromonas sediminis TaxID=2259342 RepID=A0A3N5Z9H9_9ALTE|nr:ATP-binding protein [Alteromonas sediminis]RPJ65908.1 GHKL domain-containing protein [Alteromonas sediminis]